MKIPSRRGAVLLSFVAAFAVALGGCGQSDHEGNQAKDSGGKPKEKQGQVAANNKEKKAHDHSKWWCDEHGVPESECSQCNSKIAAEFQKKGDWCDKHDRAMSQCFICNPRAKEKYAALYRTKYGKEPPPTEEEEKDKKQ